MNKWGFFVKERQTSCISPSFVSRESPRLCSRVVAIKANQPLRKSGAGWRLLVACDLCAAEQSGTGLREPLTQPDKGTAIFDTFSPRPSARCAALLLLSAANQPFHPGPVATADSANAAIWAGTGSAADFSLGPLPQMLG